MEKSNNLINITVISNIVFEPYLMRKAQWAFGAYEKRVRINYLPYEEMEIRKKLEMKPDIVLMHLSFEVLYPEASSLLSAGNLERKEIIERTVEDCRKLYEQVKNTSAQIIWLGMEDYHDVMTHVLGNVPIMQGIVDEINNKLYRMMFGESVYLDFKQIIAQTGIANAYNNRGRYLWNAPYSVEVIEKLSQELCKQYMIHKGLTRKCLVLDCDNVLWGGILAEDGLTGIVLGGNAGKVYQDFQRFILNLYYHGVILVVCSKNNEEDVINVFNEHSGMILKKEHIASFAVNWVGKPDNIRRVSKELNIGLHSIVFVDDSVHEVEAVAKELPEVKTILYSRDSVYRELSCFCLCESVDYKGIALRQQTYQTNSKRAQMRKACASSEQYLRHLDMKIEMREARQDELMRVAELTQRANKCTNGARYTVGELKEKIAMRNYFLYVVCLSDKYSDLGLVGALGIQGGLLDLYVLSCRAFGRGLESMMLRKVKEMKVSDFRFKATYANADLEREMRTVLKLH